MTGKIEITAEYWDANANNIQYKYVSPEGFLVNVSKYNNKTVWLWSVNAWGRIIYEVVDYYRFINTYRPHSEYVHFKA